jgi:hypothetical protein
LIKGNTSTTDGNIDTVTFNYERDNVYINRACAFKTIYRDPTTQLEVEQDNWINEIEINKLIIENEDEAHITIFH